MCKLLPLCAGRIFFVTCTNVSNIFLVNRTLSLAILDLELGRLLILTPKIQIYMYKLKGAEKSEKLNGENYSSSNFAIIFGQQAVF